MVDITKRSVKGSPLTNDEVDDNFDNLNTGKVGVEDIGTDPNQVPLNQYLGSMAYQDLDAVSITGGTLDGVTINGGTIDGTVIGGSTAAAISGTTGQFGTSLNVDGTVTADGVDSESADGLNLYTGSNYEAGWTHDTLSAISSINVGRNSTWGGSLIIRTDTKARASFAFNGDIGFLEDTGTSTKFFWDASEERLGIGTTSPSQALDVVGNIEVSGGVYLGGTAAANLLDDYEEGTFTPTLTPTTSGSITLNSSFNTLSYIKIGRAVSIVGRVRVSSVSSPVGQYVELSLPFAIPVGSEDETRVTGTVVVQEAAQDIDKYCLHPKNNTSYIEIGRTDNFTSNAANDFSGNELVAINLTYIIA